MHGLYLLWWVQEKHVPAAIVAAILAAGDLALMALEIPTGWFADRCGHRASLIAGSLLQVAGMLCCWLGRGIPGLTAASLLVALGDAFRSGADQALIYRSCVALGREEAFQRIEARTRAIQQAAMVGLVLAGGAIVETWGFSLGWLAETALCAVGVVIACAMVEPPSAALEPSPEDVRARRANASDKSRWRRRRNGVALAALIVPAALLGGAASALSFLAQTAGGTDPQRMTVLVAVIAVAEALGAALAVRCSAARLRSQILLAFFGGAAIALAWALPNAFVTVVVTLAFLVGVAHPSRAAGIQRLAADRMRARAASVASACDMACNTIALAIAGTLRRR